jgi:hypothetical protein
LKTKFDKLGQCSECLRWNFALAVSCSAGYVISRRMSMSKAAKLSLLFSLPFWLTFAIHVTAFFMRKSDDATSPCMTCGQSQEDGGSVHGRDSRLILVSSKVTPMMPHR